MIAHVIIVVIGILCMGTESNNPGSQDTTSARDSNQATIRTKQEPVTTTTVQTVPVENSRPSLLLHFPDGSIEEVSVDNLASVFRQYPLSRSVVLRALLVPSPPPTVQHRGYSGLSRMLPGIANRLTRFEQMGSELRRYQLYIANPALPKPGGQINLLPILKWLLSRF